MKTSLEALQQWADAGRGKRTVTVEIDKNLEPKIYLWDNACLCGCYLSDLAGGKLPTTDEVEAGHNAGMKRYIAGLQSASAEVKKIAHGGNHGLELELTEFAGQRTANTVMNGMQEVNHA